jgi:hypothetical protein
LRRMINKIALKVNPSVLRKTLKAQVGKVPNATWVNPLERIHRPNLFWVWHYWIQQRATSQMLNGPDPCLPKIWTL